MIAASLAVAASGLAVTAPPAAAHHARPSVWVGAPFDGAWPTTDSCAGARYPSADCSWPTAHHTYRYGMRDPGDWGADFGVGPRTPVVLYAAPEDRNRAVTAKVEQRVTACAPRAGETRAQTVARGGEAVVIGLYAAGTRVGWATYAHIDPAPNITPGQPIDRWNSRLGTVGSYVPNACWSGPHLHFEMTNEAHYACYNRTWRPGQQMRPSNFVGYLGGARASSPRQGCP